jgi:hypothetical protein
MSDPTLYEWGAVTTSSGGQTIQTMGLKPIPAAPLGPNCVFKFVDAAKAWQQVHQNPACTHEDQCQLPAGVPLPPGKEDGALLYLPCPP